MNYDVNYDDWREIDGFPGYSVNPLGEIINNGRGNIITASLNNFGIPRVTLRDYDNKARQKSLSTIVAETFLEPPPDWRWNTVLHKNGDQTDCGVYNLLWRPRWHVIRFHKQFDQDPPGWDTKYPFVEVDTNVVYDRIREACETDGHYHFDVRMSCLNKAPVPFTGQQYRWLEEA